MKTIASLVGLVTLAAAAGCGGPGSFDGTVAGIKLDVKSAVYLDMKDTNGKLVAVQVVLTDQDNICKTLQGGTEPGGMTGFGMQLMELDSSMSFATPKADTYTVVTNQPNKAGAYGGGVFLHLDSSCQDTMTTDNGITSSGTIKLDSLTLEKSASGSFDLIVGKQNDHVTGTFDATFCNVDPNTTLTCS